MPFLLTDAEYSQSCAALVSEARPWNPDRSAVKCVTCPICGGYGMDHALRRWLCLSPVEHECPTCGTAGFIFVNEPAIPVRLPAAPIVVPVELFG